MKTWWFWKLITKMWLKITFSSILFFVFSFQKNRKLKTKNDYEQTLLVGSLGVGCIHWGGIEHSVEYLLIELAEFHWIWDFNRIVQKKKWRWNRNTYINIRRIKILNSFVNGCLLNPNILVSRPNTDTRHKLKSWIRHFLYDGRVRWW